MFGDFFMNVFLESILRTLLAIIVLLILCRINGAKQISQLNVYDYIVGISAGSIGASLCIELNINLWAGLIAMALFMLSSLLFSVITSKSIKLRRLLSGNAKIMIAQGKINYYGLKKAHFDVDDLTRELRSQGYFDINDVEYAILENSGTVSIMPKSSSRPPNSEELNVVLPQKSLMANVIIDGKILLGNLAAVGKNEDWLRNQVARQGQEVKDVLLGELDNQGTLRLYKKEGKNIESTIFQ
jgi:uncharacterized membrane protein YcaP (DUF421 family)